MAAKTLWELFPGVPNVQDKVIIYPRAATFTAPLVAGKFAFAASVPVFTLNQSETGIIAGISLSADIDDLTFQEALDPSVNGGLFKLNLKRTGNNTPVNLADFLFGTTSQASEFACMAKPTGTANFKETFALEMTGTLLQTAALAQLGKAAIRMNAIFNLYRAKDNLKQ